MLLFLKVLQQGYKLIFTEVPLTVGSCSALNMHQEQHPKSALCPTNWDTFLSGGMSADAPMSSARTVLLLGFLPIIALNCQQVY